jgi:hypothetical protein
VLLILDRIFLRKRKKEKEGEKKRKRERERRKLIKEQQINHFLFSS